MTLTLRDVQAHPRVKTLMSKTNEFLGVIGYTEHGQRHGKVVADNTRLILEALGEDERTQELGAIAGYLHDVGNVINRDHHAQSGAFLANKVLDEMDLPFEDTVEIIGAIGNHHEGDGRPVSKIAAALILADKADTNRTRVRNTRQLMSDIHDRVNYAVTDTDLAVNMGERSITLKLMVDTRIASVMEFFEIFLDRMMMSKRAANFLELEFHLDINGSRLL
ncbi:HD domain-containing protein [bacterium]|nr:HD domain-containing protein [bacterium]MBU1651397.1 HD domain-containing protein [bacterium]